MVTTADQNSVRKFNSALVLDILRREAPRSRAELAAVTGLNRSTISSIINDLVSDGLVLETTFQSDRVGRPGLLLELNPSGGFAVGLEIGVDFLSAIVTDFTANILWRRHEKSDPGQEQMAILEHAFTLVDDAVAFGRAQGLRPLGIGIGIPALVDLHRGYVMLAPNLHWENTPLRLMVTQRFKLPVIVENDGNASALAEYYFGAARDVRNSIYLSAGVGLGAGILLDGKLFRGTDGYAAEIGHMVADPNGEQCACGKRGCYETLVSPRPVIRRVQAFLDSSKAPSSLRDVRGPLTFDLVIEAAREGDSVAVEALEQLGVNLGVVMANLINLFNPQMMILGGVLGHAADFLMPIVERSIESNALALSRQAVRLAASKYGDETCVMGAATLVLDQIMRDPV
jgi:glucokinase-like ROK family protein